MYSWYFSFFRNSGIKIERVRDSSLHISDIFLLKNAQKTGWLINAAQAIFSF